MNVSARRKYGNRKVELDGIVFASQLEARRYKELKLRERAGNIIELTVHPSWQLSVCGIKIGNYTADFSYLEDTMPGQRFLSWELKVEDCKGVRTRDYVLRRKLMKAIYGIDVIEITKEMVR